MSVVVCVARKLRPCPSYSRRRDRINLGLLHSLHKGGWGTRVSYPSIHAGVVFLRGSLIEDALIGGTGGVEHGVETSGPIGTINIASGATVTPDSGV